MLSRTGKQLNPGWLKASSEAHKGQAPCNKNSSVLPNQTSPSKHNTGSVGKIQKFSPQIIRDINPPTASCGSRKEITMCHFLFPHSVLNTLQPEFENTATRKVAKPAFSDRTCARAPSKWDLTHRVHKVITPQSTNSFSSLPSNFARTGNTSLAQEIV